MVLAVQSTVDGMAQRISDEREHRRGLVLGLTLAEVLLLLLFLLLLALGSQMEFWRNKAESAEHANIRLSAAIANLQSIQLALAANGSDVRTADELVQRLARVQQLESSIAELSAENSALKSQARLVTSLGANAQEKLKDIAGVIERATQIDPEDPPALLKRALEVLNRLGSSTVPEQVKPLSDMVVEASLKDNYAALKIDIEKARSERDNLMRGGNGLTYPSCWIDKTNNQTEYIFDVTTKDAGLIVKIIAPASRANDPAWKLVDPFDKDTLINEKVFDVATAKLFEYSKQHDCRFYARLRDGTAPESKERYIQLRTLVESHFYPAIVRIQPNARRVRDSTPQPTMPSEQPSGITLGIPWLIGR